MEITIKKFKPNRKGYIRVLLLIALAIPILVLLFSRDKILQHPLIVLLSVLPLGVLLWVYCGTVYVVEQGKLFYKSAFLKGQVDIATIQEVGKGTTSWTGIKPATAANGLLIRFNAHDELYVSPEDNDSLIEALIAVNNKIKITEER